MSETKIIAWSHSRIEMFKKCPRQFNELQLLKTVKFEQTEAMLEGERQHKMLEDRIGKGTPLPAPYMKLEPICQSVLNAPGQTFTETKLTLNNKLQPTGYFAPDAYVRVIIDVMKKQDKTAWMGDWKSGKPNFDEHQLKLFSAVGFMTYPSLEQITTSYVWLKPGILDSKTYNRAQLPQMWAELLQKPAELQAAYVMNDWKPKPGRHCRWCLVNKIGRCPDAAERFNG